MKNEFKTCFTVKNGEVYFKPNVRVGGVSVYGEIQAGTIAGIEWNRYVDHDLDVEIGKDMIVIKGIY